MSWDTSCDTAYDIWHMAYNWRYIFYIRSPYVVCRMTYNVRYNTIKEHTVHRKVYDIRHISYVVHHNVHYVIHCVKHNTYIVWRIHWYTAWCIYHTFIIRHTTHSALCRQHGVCYTTWHILHTTCDIRQAMHCFQHITYIVYTGIQRDAIIIRHMLYDIRYSAYRVYCTTLAMQRATYGIRRTTHCVGRTSKSTEKHCSPDRDQCIVILSSTNRCFRFG